MWKRRMTMGNYNEGWSDWLSLLGAPAVAMSPSYVHPWSTFYTTFLFNHDQRSTLHLSQSKNNALQNTFLQSWSTFYATLFSNHDQPNSNSTHLLLRCMYCERCEPNLKVAPTLHHIENAIQTILLYKGLVRMKLTLKTWSSCAHNLVLPPRTAEQCRDRLLLSQGLAPGWSHLCCCHLNH